MKPQEKNYKIIAALSSIIVFWGVKFLPTEYRALITLIIGISCLIVAIYYFKIKKSRKELILFSALSILSILGSLIYIEYSFWGSYSMVKIFTFVFYSLSIFAFGSIVVKSYKNKEISKLILGSFFLIALVFLATLIILKIVFKISL